MCVEQYPLEYCSTHKDQKILLHKQRKSTLERISPYCLSFAYLQMYISTTPGTDFPTLRFVSRVKGRADNPIAYQTGRQIYQKPFPFPIVSI